MDSPDRELVQRRKKRGTALSCAECRRLKLKCSRVFPCSNCEKKGCGPICPDGSLTTGKGNRFVLANTEVLHTKIHELASRVRQLEDALQQSHSTNSNQPHPLLSDELLQIKRPLERERLDMPSNITEKNDGEDAIDAIGSLAISAQGGRSTFFGQAANSWYLLQNEEGSGEDNAPALEPSMPSTLPWLSHAFPFTSSIDRSTDGVRGLVIAALPQRSEAMRLSQLYYRHAAWQYTPITEMEYHESIFRRVYDAEHEAVESHSIAVLFFILATGTLLDLDLPAHNPESTRYYQLGRAALAIDSIFDEQSIPAIQALLLMCHFMFLNDIEGPRWAVMGLVVKLAQSAGLHRDSGKWNLSEAESYQRRCLMWEIYTYDSWQSLTFGRPPSFSLLHIDSQMPHPSSKGPRGEVEMSFSAWKHAFCSQCLSIVHDQAFGARPPSYKTVLTLEKKVRLFYVPPSLQVPGFGGVSKSLGTEPEQPTTELTMQRYITFAIKEITLFYMHRGFFACALQDNPNDPMGSKYAPSVLTAYGSACSFVGLIESLFKQHPALTERMWFLFTHVFSCSIVLGSIAVKHQMALSRSALSHLESAYNLFSRVSDSKRTAKILPILQKLRERVDAAATGSPRSPLEPKAPRLSMHGERTIKSEEDEFAALGGTTRLVPRRKSDSPSSPSSHSSPTSQPASPPTMLLHSSPEPHYQTSQPALVSSEWQSYPQMTPEYQNFSPYSQSSSIPSDNGTGYIGHSQMHDFYGYQDQNAIPLSARTGYEFYQGYPQANNMQQQQYTQIVPDMQATWQNLVAQYK
ncbi:fungal-specific transcription factor domain-containing protein [Mycena floridula]|nr:fungal-specific transcription factor domain-containing protein [Mycena floridula]